MRLKRYNTMLKNVLIIASAVCAVWFIFLPQYYRFGYAVMALALLLLSVLVYINSAEIISYAKGKKRLLAANALITVLMTLAVIVMINYLAYRNEIRLDLTAGSMNTLSNQTTRILKNLDQDIHFIAFLDPVSQGASFKYAMDRYGYYTDRISYEIVDPNRDPIRAKSYNVNTYGTIIGLLDGNEVRMDSLTEEELTNALIKLTRREKKKIYFLTGHGERDIDSDDDGDYSQLKRMIGGQNYQVLKLDIVKTGSVPSDASALVVAGPRRSFFEKEIKSINEYNGKGGPLLILSDPSLPGSMVTPEHNVNRLLAKQGLRLRNDVVVDPQSKLFGVTEAMPVVQTYDPVNPITAGFREPTVYPFAQSIDVSGVDRKKTGLAGLCKTTDSSWGETGAKTGRITFDKNRDKKGPLDLCVLVSDKNGSEVVVFGNSSFVSNQYVSHAANSDIFLNALSYLVKDDDLISIRPKHIQAGRFQLKGSLAMGLFTVYVLPFSILAGGLVYWYRRRRR